MAHRAVILRTLRHAPDEALAVLAALSFAILDMYFLLAGQIGL